MDLDNLLDDLTSYLDLEASDQEALRAFGAHLEPSIDTIAETCHGEQLQGEWSHWLRQLLAGPWDRDYIARRAELARAQIARNAPRAHVVTMISALRGQLQVKADAYAATPSERIQLLLALHHLFDLELAIALESQREDAQKTRRAERLASLGTMAAGLAHELRNPLNSATLQLSVARRRVERGVLKDPRPVLRALELTEVEHQRLAALVEDFLAFAQPRPLQMSRKDIGALAARAVEELAADATARGVHLACVRAAPLQVELDADRIREVLLNLLRNALEASDPGGHVQISCERVESFARVSVQDDGCGFAPDAALFQPFYTTKDHGTGLGLAIVHRVVMDHGGSVDARRQPGRTVFTIMLPLAPANVSSQPDQVDPLPLSPEPA